DRDIYLVFESMETDLHAVIKKGNLLKDIHKCYILYQLLKATKFIHSGNVIHRDQKPSNILLDADCFVKLCDFGLARSLCQIHEDQGSPALTEYVATRWYRAPEILLSSHSYTKGVDMWSIGCILGEMLLGKPLFPGTSTVNQIEQILINLQHNSVPCINRLCGLTIEEILPSSTPAHALDLLKRLLVFNPDKRLTAEEALQHPYQFTDQGKIDIWPFKFCAGPDWAGIIRGRLPVQGSQVSSHKLFGEEEDLPHKF
uniref:mitogen-activated protein kinase n=1 Tax=Gopherus evgoodei TaxID=1825980 RepID=A0A8C4VLE9_9SAUR